MIKNLKSEEGSVVLLTMMVLVLVTMFGFSALNNAETELIVAHNSRCYKQNMYRAEGVVMETAQLLETSPVTELKPDTKTNIWLADGTDDNAFEPETEEWEAGTTTATSNIYLVNAEYAVVFEGVAPGSSLSMTETQMWQYSVYGKSDICNGEIGVVAGYRRRF